MSAPVEYGPREAEITFVTWGSTVGSLRSAQELLQAEGKSVRIVQIMDIWPLPVKKVEQSLAGAKRVILVEQNYSGQLATLLRAWTNVRPDALINRYDGRPMTPEYILQQLREVA
jgi:2-oxoglutarate ferredoxin oxidoreductase subunit alpha